MDLSPAYLYRSRTLAEVEGIKVVKCRVRVYNREFDRFSDAYFFTNTHVMLVVGRQNMYWVPFGLQPGISLSLKDFCKQVDGR